MTPHEFVAKWKRVQLTERSACQQHFLDLCDLLGQPKPAAADPEGAWYTFERGVRKTDGGKGWADVWMRGHFGWEYKGKHKDLKEAYAQLQLYREDLENPPLLVVCDMDRFEVHTNFTGTVKQVHAFDLDGLANPDSLDVLRRLFTAPQTLRPGQTTEQITEQAAKKFGKIADGMRDRGVPAPDAAHFLMKLMFCMFAEDIGLLPKQLFSKIIAGAKTDPARLTPRLRSLFEAMAVGGDFGADDIPWFNGGLFRPDEPVFDLGRADIEELIRANDFDWSYVEPSVFGTLFERMLDPSKRSQIGAHYTSREDIETLLEPVMMAPLRREWQAVKEQCEALLPQIKQAARQDVRRRKDSKPRQKFDRLLREFIERLAHVSVLDPACGSGNFLYVALHLLLDLEKETIAYAATHGLTQFPQVRPTQLAGIEINPYAHELAQVVIWIGYLQWIHHNGFATPRDPVLEPIETIRRMDAILDLSNPEFPTEPEWPAADFIVGNPPFLGGKLLRTHLGDEYVDALFKVWNGRVAREADLCCYWFEKARVMIEHGTARRAGLLATQGIRGGANREVLKWVKQSGDIFFAESDRNWILDGANVHVSMVGFDDGRETNRSLDGKPAAAIHSNLTAHADVTVAKPLAENRSIAYMGVTPSGPFVIPEDKALDLLRQPNPHGWPNSDVLLPWVNGSDLNKRSSNNWIIDLNQFADEMTVALYQGPFAIVSDQVASARKEYRTGGKNFWQFERPRPAMRAAFAGHGRYLATCMVAKHRIFVWLTVQSLAANVVIVFARSDDYFFGVLHSRVHEVWARAQGTQLRERESGFRYTPTTCFETFPFPEPTDEQRAAIAAAAKELDELRTRWLNPPEWTREEVLEFPGTTDGPWSRYVHAPDERGLGTVRYPRLVPKDADAARELKRRTLTNLYNQRPTWLALAHRKLDAAVFAAFDWQPDLNDETILEKLLSLNLKRA